MRHIVLLIALALLCQLVKADSVLFYILGGLILAMYGAAGELARKPLYLKLKFEGKDVLTDKVPHPQPETLPAADLPASPSNLPAQPIGSDSPPSTVAIPDAQDSVPVSTLSDKNTNTNREIFASLDANTANSEIKRVIWFGGAAVVILAAAAVAILKFSKPTIPYKPSVLVWDRDSCLANNFVYGAANATAGDNWKVTAEKWYCARQWDDHFYSQALTTLDKYGVTTAIWNPGRWTEIGPGDEATLPVKRFSKVLDSSVLLIMSDDELEELRSTNTYFPTNKAIEGARRKLDLDEVSTSSRALPQVYVVSLGSPSIHLITDVGLQTSLRELIHLSLADADGTNSRAEEKLRDLGIDIHGAGLETNNFALAVVLEQQIYVKIGSVLRKEWKAKPLQDLEVLYLTSRLASPMATAVPDRDGGYDPRSGRIWVRAAEMNAIKSENPSKAEVDSLAASAIPAVLEHEFYHYIFYRPQAANSGFILEGEATAMGEYFHQLYTAGTTLTADVSDPLRRLVSKIEQDPASLTAEEVDEYDRLLRLHIAAAPLTEQQCRSLSLVVDKNVRQGEEIPLGRLLSYTPRRFLDLADSSSAYAQAWAVYHTNFVLHEGWGPLLEQIANKLYDGQELGAGDQEKLSAVSRDTLSWVDKMYREKNEGCVNRTASTAKN